MGLVQRSSGRGGSGNITDPRRRSRSQEPRTVPKKRLLRKKGRERRTICCDSDMVKRYGGARTYFHDPVLISAQRATSRTTWSSGSSRVFGTRHSQVSCVGNAVTSGSDVTAVPLLNGDAITGHPRKRQSCLTSWGKPLSLRGSMAPPGSPCSPPSAVPRSRQSWHMGSFGSSLSAHSSKSVVSKKDQKYVSFLEL